METYGIKLELLANNFKNKMNQIKNMTKNATNEIKQNFNQIKEKTLNVEIKNSSQENIIKIQQLKNEIKTLKYELNTLKPNDKLFREYALAIDIAEKELKELVKQQKKSKIESENMNVGHNKMKNTSNLFSQITKKITRYGLALLSLRSIFSMVSRASSSYLSQDTQLANKLQSVWSGLGSFFAPIIEKIANMMLKLISYLNIFVKAVTGQDLLAKASKKATDRIKEQTKATKSLNKALSSLDEISNINMDEQGGGVSEMENPFENFQNVEINTSWADKIEKFGNWIKDNWEYVALGITGIAFAIAGLELICKGGSFAKFGKILLGIGITIIGITGAFHEFKEYLKLVDEGLENSKEGWETFWNTLKFVGIAIAGVGIAIGSLPVIIIGAIVTIISLIAKYWSEIKKGIEKAVNWIVEKTKWLFGDTIGDIIIAPFVDAVDMIVEIFEGVFKGVKQIIDGIIKIFKGDFAGGLKLIGKGIANVLIGLLNGLISSLNLFLTPFRSIIVLIGKAMGKKITMGDVKLPKVPYLNVGTNYVPEDQLAYIHKGEAVIPKKFNSSEYFNKGNNNDEIKELLNETNILLSRIEAKENKTYLDGKEIGKSTVNYIKTQNRILGRSVI